MKWRESGRIITVLCPLVRMRCKKKKKKAKRSTDNKEG